MSPCLALAARGEKAARWVDDEVQAWSGSRCGGGGAAASLVAINAGGGGGSGDWRGYMAMVRAELVRNSLSIGWTFTGLNDVKPRKVRSSSPRQKRHCCMTCQLTIGLGGISSGAWVPSHYIYE